MKRKLKRLSNQPRWKIAVFALALNALLFWQAAIDYYFYLNFNFLFARRAFFKRTSQRAHWVGVQVAKPHRLAFTILAVVLLFGVIEFPNTQLRLYWAIGWGSAFSVFVIYRSAVLFLQHRWPPRPFNPPY